MKLLILGAGHYGQLVKEIAKNKYTIVDFLDDNSKMSIRPLNDYLKLKNKYNDAIVAIGDNNIRMMWLIKLEKAGYNLATIISDKAFISLSSIIEPGVIIEPMAVIHISSKISKGSIISAGAVVNHNAVIEQGSHIDCNAVVGADTVVPEKMFLRCGQVFEKNKKL